MNQPLLLPRFRQSTRGTVVRKHLKHYTLLRKVGEGSLAVVVEGIDDKTGERVAIKIYVKGNVRAEHNEQRLQQEVDSMSFLDHPNIVKLIDFFWDSDNFYLVSKFCPGSDLNEYIKLHGKIPEPIAAIIFKQMVAAVSYCHARGVVHRNLGPKNILIDHFPGIKVTNFGYCEYIDPTKLMARAVGDPLYRCPESLVKIYYDGRSADIWSLGVILYTMVVGYNPWEHLNNTNQKKQITLATYQLPDFISKNCSKLIKSILRVNPKDRPTPEMILAHSWFDCIDEAPTFPPNLDVQHIKTMPSTDITIAQISSAKKFRRKDSIGIETPFTDDEETQQTENKLITSTLSPTSTLNKSSMPQAVTPFRASTMLTVNNQKRLKLKPMYVRIPQKTFAIID